MYFNLWNSPNFDATLYCIHLFKIFMECDETKSGLNCILQFARLNYFYIHHAMSIFIDSLRIILALQFNDAAYIPLDLVKVIQQENYNYSDPITEFLASLYVDFDFDAAQEKLQLCADVLKNDFFLVACMKDFIDNARLMIFELFCRIHQCISINMLAEKLNMTPPDAERWIVDLIRQAKLDAKIDSQQGHVVMGTQAISPYQQLIEKTKNLSFRTQMLAMNIEKKANTARSNEVVFKVGG
ncbi:hypothetical protein HAZT_HAZT004342 [Hyalella azteca]|uniref:PCI domain-containing protein n=1 Tax=Hyalella azteca TaxID=294128 RepID=A0A6A0GYB6_HYAAZ|nr:hypothetical protein HAZT_HAZT004342 [Hyalella azteca]